MISPIKLDFNRETNTVTCTVRELVDLVCRSGSIGGRGTVSAADGIQAHKNFEDASSYAMLEVPLEYETVIGGTVYRIVGRADMITPDGECDIVEELKTTQNGFVGGSSDIPQSHIAQGILYAFFWCSGTGCKKAAVRITYLHKGSSQKRSFESVFSVDELRAEAEGLITEYSMWAGHCIRRECERSTSIKSLRFPYGEPREGQIDFMSAVMRAVRKRGCALIQAPTGTGKTMAALYPSVKSIGADYADRIFYLTAKTSTRLAAENAVSVLLEKLPPLRAVTILAKERVCPNADMLRSGVPCSAEGCSLAAGHYDRVGDAVWELISTIGVGKSITPRDIISVAERHRVCPYELSLDVSDFCDIIICDYNYVFDPRVFLRRFFGDDPDSVHKSERYVLLCDEAHNLVDRARDMFSASLKLSEIEKCVLLSERDDELNEALRQLSDGIRGLRGRCDELSLDSRGKERGFSVGAEPLTDIVSLSSKAADLCGRASYFMRRSDDESEKRISSALSTLRRNLNEFVDSAEGFDRRCVSYIEVFGDDIKCSHLCLDASEKLTERRRRAAATVMFSATLAPPDYFARVLGCAGCDSYELPSPYDSRNLCLLAADKISTRMQDRAITIPEIANMVYAAACSKRGNYICYLPSYSYLKLLVREFKVRIGTDDIELVIQNRHMSELERERFISSFTSSPQKTRVGFSVLGGVFSEGVDLPGDRLSGVVIVGVGLPQLSAETNLLRDYYERICERGYEFAYLFPGMNKVLQAAGRVIRGENDRGIVLLIDDRFASQEYRRLFPAHWRGLKYVGDLRSLSSTLNDFWSENQ